MTCSRGRRYERENTRCLGRFRPGGKGQVNWVIGLKWSEWRMKSSDGHGQLSLPD